jgi:hypothetical protein
MANFCSTHAEMRYLSLQVPGCESTHDDIVWIRGIWHYLNISLQEEVNRVSIFLYQSGVLEEKRNETNYYQWEYDGGVFKDTRYRSYIVEDKCLHIGSVYSFFIGIDQYASGSDWVLEIYMDDERILSKDINVVDAVCSLILKSTPVVINAKPFVEDDFLSEGGFIVENVGNVPVALSVSYGEYEHLFSTLDLDEILLPGQKGTYTVVLHSKSDWEPGLLKIRDAAYVKGDVLYIIRPKKVVYLIESNVSFGLGINVYIGHTGCELASLPHDITFQYVKDIEVHLGETIDIVSYICGNGEVTLNLSGKYLKILKILSGGVEVKTPISIVSTNTSEHIIVVRVAGVMANTTAYLHYELEVDGEHRVFTTRIHVGPPTPLEESIFTTFILELSIMACIAIVALYMLYSQMKYWKK